MRRRQQFYNSRMYLPEAFAVTDAADVEAFMRQHEFVTLVSAAGGSVAATHIPVMVSRQGDAFTISGHVARANAHWQTMDGASEALVIFLGPHAYVSPTWYATAPAVPTWNYVVVHAYGRPRTVTDHAALEQHLRALAQRHEEGRPGPWRIDDLSPDYRARLLSAIVGFEMPVDRLEAKFKLGQNRSAADRQGMLAGLESEDNPSGRALAAFMRSRLRHDS
jgi:transcriptional regulator